MVGIALLSALNEIDLAGLLKPDSRIKDLPLVMALATSVLEDADDMSYGYKINSWRHGVVAYANKAGIDLRQAAPIEAASSLKRLEALYEEASTGRRTASLTPPQMFRSMKEIQQFFKEQGPNGMKAMPWPDPWDRPLEKSDARSIKEYVAKASPTCGRGSPR
jgi:hypothetical protein